MNYILKQFDNDLLYFSMENTNDELQVHIISVDEKMKSQIPLDLDINDKSLKRWLEKELFQEIEHMCQIFYQD